MSRVADRIEWAVWWVAALVLSLFIGASGCRQASPPVPQAVETQDITDLRNATATLYSQDRFGDYNMACTATVVGQTKGGYFLITAAHCVSVSNFVTFDDGDEVTMIRAEPVDLGLQKVGEDWAILVIKTHKRIPAVCLGSSALMMPREPVTSVACSLGMGKTEVDGRVELLRLQRPFQHPEENYDWTNYIIADINISQGASGALLYSTRQRAAVGIICGITADTHVVVMPIERVRFP
jgi:hypothetical protein